MLSDYLNLIATLSVLILNIFQSIKSGHFKSQCSNCCEIEHDITTHSPLKSPTKKSLINNVII